MVLPLSPGRNGPDHNIRGSRPGILGRRKFGIYTIRVSGNKRESVESASVMSTGGGRCTQGPVPEMPSSDDDTFL
jgi:hypothetical protein